MENKERKPVTKELPRPASVPCPYEARYETDVVVLGCGFAGLNAAVTARESGRRVLVVDKGRPGFSGLSPWPSSFRWFDPEKDDADAFRRAVLIGGDYISNMKWYEEWITDSKRIYHRLRDWGMLTPFPKPQEAGDFFERQDYAGYREAFQQLDRHEKWVEVLEKNGIPFLEYTMVTDVIVEEGRVRGVMGFHVPSGKVIAISARAVVMAMGGGCYKPSGFPAGGDTFDGEYIAYELGLPISGKEFEDSHGTSSVAPGSPFYYMNWQYLENIWPGGGDASQDNLKPFIESKVNFVVLGRARAAKNRLPASTGKEVTREAETNALRRGAALGYETDPDEIRSGKLGSPLPASDTHGGAIGMSSHLTGGVLCDLEDVSGRTGIDGLYVAGDGMHASYPGGASYPCGRGFTSCFCSIDGDHAGRAAAAFAAEATLQPLSEETVAERTEAITAPLRVERGFDPNWARDVLHGFMAPYWVTISKSEKVLEATLVQVEYMRDHVAPYLMARTSHDLRLCHEMKHKILSAEMKLRASLYRKESRGATYREDYPYRDDEHFLCYLTVNKTGEGMEIREVPVKEEWTGDREQAYEKRYLCYYPGEPEARGFHVEPPRWMGGGKKP